MKPVIAIVLAAFAAGAAFPQAMPTFSTSRSEVVVNVTVLGRDGKPVETLTRDDFLIYEDGKLQAVQGFRLERLETKQLPPVELIDRQARAPEAASPAAAAAPAQAELKLDDRRLIVLLFDFSSMQIPDQIRALDSAARFIRTQMTASDMVSIMVFGSELKTVQDFTDDRDLLISTLRGFHIGEASELAGMADTGADSEDQSGSYVADETEFNIFNTDRKLAALQDAARRLAEYSQKKALVYFSGGVEKTGVDNQSQLRATTNTAVRANVAFYPIDARGLTAAAPGGNASDAGAVGSSLYRGAGQRSLRDSFNNQQETLYSLAADTGGKALLDSNDLALGISQIQKDMTSYYSLTYASANAALDGRYRRIQVKLAPRAAGLSAKLDYRQGYFAATTFERMSGSDKEAQLQQALDSENPVTDLPVAVEVDYFRMAKAKYFVPVSVRIPGSALAFRSKGAKAATELDFIAHVRDTRGRIAAVVRDTIPLKLDEATAGKVTQKNVQYDTGLTLGPGKYTLRFVARENGDGKIGTFETPFTIPDLGSGSNLRLSSVVFSNQRQPVSEQIAGVKGNKRLSEHNPLVDASGTKIVPNVTRVFRPGQDLYAYVEVYDPAAETTEAAKTASVAASLALYRGHKKVVETAPVRVNHFSQKREGTVPLLLETALKNIEPGQYTCQVTIIDEIGRKFSFPRSTVVVI